MSLVKQLVGSTTPIFIDWTSVPLCGTWLKCLVSDLTDDAAMRWHASAEKCLCLEVDGQMTFMVLNLCRASDKRGVAMLYEADL